MKTTIYLLRGGTKKTGYWYLPNYFNYRKSAKGYMSELIKDTKSQSRLKIIKFTSEEME